MFAQSIIREFSNIGFAGARRAFPGLPAKSESLRHKLAPRQTYLIQAKKGDLISARALGVGQSFCALVFLEDGKPGSEALGLEAQTSVPASEFDGD